MNTIQTIMTRESIRRYSDRHIEETDLNIILKAGMRGPSCANRRDWTFLVVREREMLKKMALANGPAAKCLENANVGILVCCDLERAFAPAKDYAVIDCSIAMQNMILAATDLGIGSCYLGVWPQMERVEKQKELFGLPDSQIPHSILSLGYPHEEGEIWPEDWPEKTFIEWEADRVHYEQW